VVWQKWTKKKKKLDRIFATTSGGEMTSKYKFSTAEKYKIALEAIKGQQMRILAEIGHPF
jgi:hypothetical protein